MDVAKDGWLRVALAVGLASIIGYAIQHPLVKPFAASLASGVEPGFWARMLAAAKSSVAAEFIILVCALVTFAVSARARTIFCEMISAPYRWKTAALALLATVTNVLYMFNIASFDPSYVALVSNIFPIYLVVATFVFSGDDRPPGWEALLALITCLVLAAIVVLTAESGGTMSSAGAIDSDRVVRFLFVSLVPILFVANRLAFVRFFHGRSPGSEMKGADVWDEVRTILIRSVIIAGIDSPIAFVIGQGIVSASTGGPFLGTGFNGVSALFVLGTLCSFLIGGALLQVAIYLGGSRTWMVFMLFFLIPALVPAIAAVTETVTGVHIQNVTGLTWQSSLIVSGVLFVYYCILYRERLFEIFKDRFRRR